MQVTRTSEEQRLDQQRMMLSINHKGIIQSVNPGSCWLPQYQAQA
jgi:hypothetical protein